MGDHSRAYSDYDQIAEGLYVGAFPEPETVKVGMFDVIVFCAKELQPSSRRGYPVAEVLRIRIDDARLNPEILGAATSAAKAVAERVTQGKRVLVTCAAGINRSAFVAALALVRLTGKPGWHAAELVKLRRRCLGIGNRRLCPLSNQTFLDHLVSLR